MMIMELAEALYRVVFLLQIKVHHWNYYTLLILEKRENWRTQPKKNSCEPTRNSNYISVWCRMWTTSTWISANLHHRRSETSKDFTFLHFGVISKHDYMLQKYMWCIVHCISGPINSGLQYKCKFFFSFFVFLMKDQFNFKSCCWYALRQQQQIFVILQK